MKRIVKYKTILQARSTSTRLPGKSMMKICESHLLCCAKRLSSNSINNSLVVATSVDKSDNYLSKICKE